MNAPPVGRRLQPAELALRRLAWNVLTLPRRLLDHHVRSRLLPSRIQHVHGPATVDYADDEVVLICVVRDGALHVRDFIEHHMRLGIQHIVFLDNGSTDGTVEIAAEHPRVTLLQTDAPFARYENVMRRYLARRFSTGQWNLCVDIDERFDYPYSGTIRLREFIQYLNGRGFTSALAQMLDLFHPELTTEAPPPTDSTLRDAFPCYDLSHVEKTEYDWGAVPRADIMMHWGGVRRSLFGTRNGLTKAALVRADPDVDLFVDWHHAPASRIADVTTVLLHYPFAGSFASKVEDAVRTGRYGAGTTTEYRSYQRALLRTPVLQPDLNGVRRLRSIDTLLEEGFLVASPAYRSLLPPSTPV